MPLAGPFISAHLCALYIKIAEIIYFILRGLSTRNYAAAGRLAFSFAASLAIRSEDINLIVSRFDW